MEPEVTDEDLARIFEIVGAPDEDYYETDLCDGCEEEYFVNELLICNFCSSRYCENCIDDHEMGEHERPASPSRELP